MSNPFMYRWYFLLLLLLPVFVIAQSRPTQPNMLPDTLRGTVLDALSGEAMPYVTVKYGSGFTDGVVTNGEGKFRLKTPLQATQLAFSYIGYKPFVVLLDTVKKFPLYVFLTPDNTYQTEEVVITGDTENPAHKIIKRTLANERQLNPKKFPYTCMAYTKLSYDFIFNANTADIDTTLPEFLQRTARRNSDSLQARMQRRFHGGHWLLMESVANKSFLPPGREREEIIGTKISGFQDPSFGPTTDIVQPFSFYDDFVRIIELDYVSPLSPGSWRKYDFKLIDTVFTSEGDSLFVITFKPERGAAFSALAGTMQIHSRGYGLQYIDAQPAFDSKVKSHLWHTYSQVADGRWFPQELKFEITLPESPSPRMGTKSEGSTIITNVNLSPVFTDTSFSGEVIVKRAGATHQDSAFWQKFRADSLSARDQITYRVLDSIGEKKNLDKKVNQAQRLIVFGRWDMGPVSLMGERLFARNTYEGLRLGMGLQTNQRFSKRLRLSAFGGYGLQSQAWNYGGEIRYTLRPKQELHLSLGYSNEVVESGKLETNAIPLVFSGRQFRQFRRVDWYNGWRMGITGRFLTYGKFDVSFNNYIKNPAGYDYTFRLPNGVLQQRDFTFSDIRIGFRYSYGEKLMDIGGQKLSIGTPYPVFNLTYIQGLKGVMGGQYAYQRLESSINWTGKHPNFGICDVRVEAGKIWGNTPLMNTFAGNGVYSSQYSLRVLNSFQTMRFFEFIGDTYANVFFSQDFPKALYRVSFSAPRPMLIHNMGVGWLSNPGLHENTTFKTLDKGYVESGLFLNDALRFTYFGILKVGIGVGAYLRYGANALPNPSDNWAFMLRTSFSSN